MTTNLALYYVAIVALILVIVVAFRMRTRRFSLFMSDLFAGRECPAATLQEVRDRLEVINRESSTYTFYASRVAEMSAYGEIFFLVDGLVVTQSIRVHSTTTSYTIADERQALWMRRYADIFDVAFSGSTWSVFWVNASGLSRLTRRCSQPLACVRPSFP